ncbi:MAG: YggS family pyridoxal phosphate-dependent enzyme [Candidatus Omnitrophota bacterium]
MTKTLISDNVKRLMGEIPSGVEIVAAAKTRTPEEVITAVDAGIKIVGENYVQEAIPLRSILPPGIKMHFIGHLQKNKVKKAVEVFDLIETVDSSDIAREVDKRCRAISHVMPVLIEVNSGREEQKHGVFPEKAEDLIKEISVLSGIKVMGIMTMGFFSEDSGELRPLFRETKKLFDKIAEAGIPRVEMRWLSMGMSGSYNTAIEEGSNLVRIGTDIFGERI